MMAEPVGDLRQQSLEEIWQSQSFHNWRKEMGSLEICAKCLEPGAIRYSAYTEGLSYFKFLRKLGKNKFQQSFNQEGFSKYFGY
jgi:MoaA/NifB/PqqE/SkfB family radical SAM enzyme